MDGEAQEWWDCMKAIEIGRLSVYREIEKAYRQAYGQAASSKTAEAAQNLDAWSEEWNEWHDALSLKCPRGWTAADSVRSFVKMKGAQK